MNRDNTELFCLLYARVSVDTGSITSTDDQIKKCKERAEKDGYTIAGIYIDNAISGRTNQRPKLIQLLDDTADSKKFPHKIDAIYTEAMDRLSRDQADIATIHKHMQYYGIQN